MKILVTGSAGFIGFHLVNKLVLEGHIVKGVDNINDYYDPSLKFARLEETGISKDKVKWGESVESEILPNYSFIRGDLSKREFTELLFKENEFDSVIHLAAQPGVRYSLINPHAYIESNVVAFLNILEGCRRGKVEKLLYASSSSVYGLNSKVPFEEDDRVDNPISLYAATKKSNELMAHTYSHLYGIQTIGLRFFTVYGPWGRPDMAPMLFANAATKGETIKVFNNGEQYRDFTYIDDIVNGVRDCVEQDLQKNSSVLNIGRGKPVSLMNFIDLLEKSLGVAINKEFVEAQPGDVSKTWADIGKLESEIHYKPKTDLDEGIKIFANWYTSFFNL